MGNGTCPGCGAPVTERDKCCPYCGSLLKRENKYRIQAYDPRNAWPIGVELEVPNEIVWRTETQTLEANVREQLAHLIAAQIVDDIVVCSQQAIRENVFRFRAELWVSYERKLK